LLIKVEGAKRPLGVAIQVHVLRAAGQLDLKLRFERLDFWFSQVDALTQAGQVGTRGT
jgi:hypothetical protein